MNNRIVTLMNKATGEETPFPSVATLVRKVGEQSIGICIGALYNALSKGQGTYENRRVIIKYKTINITPQVWE